VGYQEFSQSLLKVQNKVEQKVLPKGLEEEQRGS
jgi:hypothetical protein